MKRKKHRSSYTISVDATVHLDDIIGEIDDDMLVEEIAARGLSAEALATETDMKCDVSPGKRREMITDMICDLVCGRTSRGAAALDAFISTFIPAELIEARDAIRAGQSSSAICLLDRYLDPSPAATATLLPKKEATIQ